ncbi:CarD family transcriptional regulator [Ammoniphilus resinae]|uniref:CarD family transcriptional regulator n=1 Tax=Ammoniphilus resinae TaxID=861532 RepID=A0ABS4GRW2_9BACL|nr:CarD family transcriptional regulator [Ammoniphilus resinae]MBP1933020.1 CarD family transcriptional regulator [Ammoniphilus resinae]
MFIVGEKIFYPLHGAGIVEGIQEKEILGEKESYYIINMTLRNLQVMIPVGKTDHLEIREVVGLEILDDAIAMFQQGRESSSTFSYQQRQRINTDKMKSGNIYEGVQVILDLMTLKSKKRLGLEDKTMLDTAKQMLISEIVVVKGIDKYEAAQLLNQTETTLM